MSGTVGENSLRMLGAQVAGNAGYFISVLILARGLAPYDRGAVAFVTVTALVISSLASFGAAEATKVFVARRPAARSRLLSNVVLASACGALLGGGIACGALLALGDARPAGVGKVELAAIVAGATAGAIALAAMAFLQGCSRFIAYSRVLAAGPWAYAVMVGALLAGPGLSVGRAVTAWVAAQAVAAVVLVGAALHGVGFGRPDGRLMRESIRFGLRAWLGGLAHLLNARVDQVLLGLLASQAALGTYAVAVNGSEVLFYLPSAVATALLPVVARSDAAAGVERTLRVFRAVVVVTAAAVLVAAALGPLLLPLIFGQAYAGSVEPFLWLLPSAFGFAASAVFSNALLASGAPALSSLGPVVSLAVGVALDLMLMPTLGAVGAAIAASAALLIGGTVAVVAYGIRAGLRPAALIPRRADVELLASRAMRRAGARPS
ncbi:MAG TPA: oligosaccharide flippase family protein [Solirubrobacteraceae bacterium]|nr:oligosaccharide flippase family protein [Solirubrobacteraceae bacterium]